MMTWPSYSLVSKDGSVQKYTPEQPRSYADVPAVKPSTLERVSGVDHDATPNGAHNLSPLTEFDESPKCPYLPDGLDPADFPMSLDSLSKETSHQEEGSTTLTRRPSLSSLPPASQKVAATMLTTLTSTQSSALSRNSAGSSELPEPLFSPYRPSGSDGSLNKLMSTDPYFYSTISTSSPNGTPQGAEQADVAWLTWLAGVDLHSARKDFLNLDVHGKGRISALDWAQWAANSGVKVSLNAAIQAILAAKPDEKGMVDFMGYLRLLHMIARETPQTADSPRPSDSSDPGSPPVTHDLPAATATIPYYPSASSSSSSSSSASSALITQDMASGTAPQRRRHAEQPLPLASSAQPPYYDHPSQGPSDLPITPASLLPCSPKPGKRRQTPEQLPMDIAKAEEQFRKLDVDGDGHISVQDWATARQVPLSEAANTFAQAGFSASHLLDLSALMHLVAMLGPLPPLPPTPTSAASSVKASSPPFAIGVTEESKVVSQSVPPVTSHAPIKTIATSPTANMSPSWFATGPLTEHLVSKEGPSLLAHHTATVDLPSSTPSPTSGTPFASSRFPVSFTPHHVATPPTTSHSLQPSVSWPPSGLSNSSLPPSPSAGSSSVWQRVGETQFEYCLVSGRPHQLPYIEGGVQVAVHLFSALAQEVQCICTYSNKLQSYVLLQRAKATL